MVNPFLFMFFYEFSYTFYQDCSSDDKNIIFIEHHLCYNSYKSFIGIRSFNFHISCESSSSISQIWGAGAETWNNQPDLKNLLSNGDGVQTQAPNTEFSIAVMYPSLLFQA